MLIKRKGMRSHREDRRLALILATTAGVLNALALGAFGFFPSHMSGNTSMLSTEVTGFDVGGALFLGAILLAFFCGAFCARLTIVWGLKRKLRTIFCLVLLIEGILLTLMALFEFTVYARNNNREAIIFLAFLMGIHNTNSTQLSDGRVRSTHITGTLTDAAISLGSLISSLNNRTGLRSSRRTLYTHFTTLISFLGGGIAGLVMFQCFGFSTMLGVGVFLILVASAAIAMTLNTSCRWRSGTLSSQK